MTELLTVPPPYLPRPLTFSISAIPTRRGLAIDFLLGVINKPEEHARDAFVALLEILNQTYLKEDQTKALVISLNRAGSEAGMARVCRDSAAQLFKNSILKHHVLFEHLRQHGLEQEFEDICRDVASFVPIKISERFLAWQKRNPAPVIVPAVETPELAAAPADSIDVLSEPPLLSVPEGFRRPASFVDKTDEKSQKKFVNGLIENPQLYDADAIAYLLEMMDEQNFHDIVDNSRRLSSRLGHSGVGVAGKSLMKELFPRNILKIHALFEVIRERSLEDRFETLCKRGTSFVPQDVSLKFMGWQKRNPAPVVVNAVETQEFSSEVPVDNAPVANDAPTLLTIPTKFKRPGVFIGEVKHEAEQRGFLTHLTANARLYDADAFVYLLELMDEQIIDKELKNMGHIPAWARIPQLQGGYSKQLKAVSKSCFPKDILRIHALFDVIREYGLEDRFEVLCRRPTSYIPFDVGQKFLTWQKHNPGPVAAVIEAATPAAPEPLIEVAPTLPVVEDVAPEPVAVIPEEPILKHQMSQTIQMNGHTLDIEIVLMDHELVIDPRETDAVSPPRFPSETTKRVRAENRQNWLIEALAQSGIASKIRVYRGPTVVAPQDKQFPYEVFEMEIKGERNQVLLCNWKGKASFVQKRPDRITRDTRIHIDVLRDDPAAFRVFNRNRDQAKRQILALLETPLSNLDAQAKHQVSWRKLGHRVKETFAGYIVRKGRFPSRDDSRIINDDGLANRDASWRKVGSIMGFGRYIDGLKGVRTFRQLYNAMLLEMPELQTFMGTSPIDAQDIYYDAEQMIVATGLVPQEILIGDMQDSGMTFAGRPPRAVSLAFKYHAVAGTKAGSVDEFMIEMGLAKRTAEGELVPALHV